MRDILFNPEQYQNVLTSTYNTYNTYYNTYNTYNTHAASKMLFCVSLNHLDEFKMSRTFSNSAVVGQAERNFHYGPFPPHHSE